MDAPKLMNLVQQAQSGDSDAVSILFEEYKDVVYSIAMRETKNRVVADDIVQETFIEVILNIGRLEHPTAFPSWLKAVAYHQCTRHYKKKETVHEINAVENEDGFSVFDTIEEKNAVYIPDEALDQKEFRATILGMIDDLPDAQRAALHMFYFEELPLKVIAKIQGVSVNTANTRLNRGRLAMKSAITNYEKKNGIRLHTIAFFPFFKWLLKGSQKTMPSSSVAKVAENISVGTGITVASAESGAAVAGTAAISSSTASAEAGATVGLGAKIAAIPVVTKITAGIVAASIAIGLPIAISKHTKDEHPEIIATETSEVIIVETEEVNIETEIPTEMIPTTVPDVTEPSVKDALDGYHVVIDQYAEAMAHHFYFDPETGMPMEIDDSLVCYLSSELSSLSRAYRNYGGSDEEDLLVYYATVDINSDEINELIIGAGTDTENISIFAFFTLLDNIPVRVVDDYSLGYRSIVTIMENLSFQIYGSGGWATYGYYFCILEKGNAVPTVLYTYRREDEHHYYYEDGNGNRAQISEEEFLAATDRSNFKAYDMPWMLIESPMQGGTSDATDSPETEPTESRVNLIDSFTAAQQRSINVFFSNFVETCSFSSFPDCTDSELLHFAYEHCKINTKKIEELENNQCRLSDDVVDSTLMRFFSKTISHKSMGVFEYRDGYYYFPAMDGEFRGYLAIVDALYRNEDGTYDVEFAKYAVYDEYNYNVRNYYGLRPNQVSLYPELTETSRWIATVRDYTKTNGDASYQLISMELVELNSGD